MKRTLVLAPLLLAFAARLGAQVFLFDDFTYSDGNIVTNSSGAWTNHSGSGGDSLVQGGRYQVRESRTDDINRQLSGYAGGSLFVSFTLNAASVPSTVAGNYFAHFKDNTISNFYARVFALGTGSIPGTFRLGVSAGTNIASKTFPLDLATNLDYQVVLSWDPLNLFAQLWINPAAESDPLVFTVDFVPGYQPITSYAFRQATGEGVLSVDDLLVGSSFGTVATNAPKKPVFGMEPHDVSVFSGNDTNLIAVAAGTGTLMYEWRKGSTAVGLNTNVHLLSAVSGADAGDYTLVVTGSGGSVTSIVAHVTVNTTPTQPFFTVQPQNQTNVLGGTVNLRALADGTGPISYQWYLHSTNLPGQTSPTLTISNLSQAQVGPYYVTATGGAGDANSSTSYVAVLPPVATNIAYLRTLQDTNTWLPTNTTSLWQIEGVVYTHTNIGSTANSSFYMHDGTAGINVFILGSTTFRPRAGDLVRIVGPLGVFSTLLEMNLVATNANHSATILSSNNPMPLSTSFFNFSQVTNRPFMEALEGSPITITNVSLQGGGGAATFVGNATFYATNAAGQIIQFFLNTQTTTVAGKPKPAFAQQITAALGQNSGNYQMILSRYEDIITNAHAPFSLSGGQAGTATQVNWPAAAGATYSLHTASDLAGPWTRAVFGLNFLDTNGAYTATNVLAPQQFIRLSAP